MHSMMSIPGFQDQSISKGMYNYICRFQHPLLSLTDYRVVAVFLERRHGYALQHQRSTTFVVIAVKTSTKTDATEMVSMRLQAQPMQL